MEGADDAILLVHACGEILGSEAKGCLAGLADETHYSVSKLFNYSKKIEIDFKKIQRCASIISFNKGSFLYVFDEGSVSHRVILKPSSESYRKSLK